MKNMLTDDQRKELRAKLNEEFKKRLIEGVEKDIYYYDLDDHMKIKERELTEEEELDEEIKKVERIIKENENKRSEITSKIRTLLDNSLFSKTRILGAMSGYTVFKNEFIKHIKSLGYDKNTLRCVSEINLRDHILKYRGEDPIKLDAKKWERFKESCLEILDSMNSFKIKLKQEKLKKKKDYLCHLNKKCYRLLSGITTKCKSCKKELRKGSNFCDYCGTKVES